MSGPPAQVPEFSTATGVVLDLPENGVDVWRIRLDTYTPRLASLRGLLSGSERETSERHGTSALRSRYVVRHGVLRSILARYLRRDPRDLDLATEPGGRPFVAGGADRLDFSLGDSSDIALVAVARARTERVGIDVERVRPVIDAAEIAARWFSPASRHLLGLPGAAKDRAFFEGWTRLEAAMKSEGLALPSLVGMSDARRLKDLADSALLFEPHEGYVGALVPGLDPARIRWLDAP